MKYKIIIFLVILSTLIAGCHVVPAGYSISKKAASPKILPGFGGITGVVTQGDEGQPVEAKSIHLAAVYRSDNSAAYIYDAANSPSTVTDENGEFSFSSVPSGEYVIVIGDQMSSPQIVSDDQGKARVWIIQPDQITNTDQIKSVKE